MMEENYTARKASLLSHNSTSAKKSSIGAKPNNGNIKMHSNKEKIISAKYMFKISDMHLNAVEAKSPDLDR